MSRKKSKGMISISEARDNIGNKVNLLGAVLEFSLPRKSYGTDYVCILKIVDPSQQSPELSVHIFTEKCDQLPLVKSNKDLIFLRGVMIEEYEDEVCAIFNKKFSSFGLFGGKVSTDVSCYQAFGMFPLLGSDKDLIVNRRNWLSNAQFDSGQSDYLMSVQDMSEERPFFDLVCKVLYATYEDNKGRWVLFVWDGTDIPPLSLVGNLKEEEEIPLHVESCAIDQDMLLRFPRVGTVLRVFANKSHTYVGVHFQVGEQWVRIRNMSCNVRAGMWHGCLCSSSKIRLLPDDDGGVVECKRKFKERRIKLDRLPLWGSPSGLTVIDFEDAQLVTLMDVITHAQEDDFIYCCVVRVVAIHPIQIDFSSFSGTNKDCLRLTLEDPTARIRALLCGEEKMRFFEGCPPHSASAKIKRLLGVAEHQSLDYEDDDITRYPPLIKCCIDSQSDLSGNRTYYVSCTRLAS